MLFLLLFRDLPPVICPMYFAFLCLSCSVAQMAVRLNYQHFQTHYHICVVNVCTWKCQMNVEITATSLIPSLDKFATDLLTLRVKGKGVSYMSLA